MTVLGTADQAAFSGGDHGVVTLSRESNGRKGGRMRLKFDGDVTTPIFEEEIDLGDNPTNQRITQFTIVNASVTPTSKIVAMQSGVAGTGKAADEPAMEPFVCHALPSSGQFTLTVVSLHGPLHGKHKVNYIIGV